MSFPDYETPIGRQIHGFLSGELTFPPQVRHLLFAANRWEKALFIKKLQDEGQTIIVNRYTESNLAYGVANGLPLDWLIGLETGLPRTNLVILLDATPAAVASRRPGKDAYEEDDKLQYQTRRIYKTLAAKFGWVVVQGSDNIGVVHDSIVNVVEKRLRRPTS